MVRNALLPQEPTTVLRNEQVVFYADAAKILVLFQQVEIEEILAVAFAPPQVNEMGYEVDSRFVGNYKAWL